MKNSALLKDPRYRVLGLTAAALVFFYVICWNLVLKPQADKLGALRDERRVETRKSSLLSKIVLHEGKMRQQKTRFSGSAEPSWLVEEVTSMAAETGIAIETLTPQTPQVTDEFMTLSLNLDARADYHSIGHFLSRVESGAVFIKVVSVKVTNDESDDPSLDGGRLRLAMTLSVLYPVRGVLR